MQTQATATKTLSARNTAIELICYALIILFIYAGLYKLMDFRFFRLSLAKSPLIGGFAGILVYLVPIGEIFVAGLLFNRRYRLAALGLATAIMIGFTAYITYIIYFSPHIPCNCGGILQRMSWRQHLVFNIFFVVLGVAGLLLENSRRKTAK